MASKNKVLRAKDFSDGIPTSFQSWFFTKECHCVARKPLASFKKYPIIFPQSFPRYFFSGIKPGNRLRRDIWIPREKVTACVWVILSIKFPGLKWGMQRMPRVAEILHQEIDPRTHEGSRSSEARILSFLSPNRALKGAFDIVLWPRNKTQMIQSQKSHSGLLNVHLPLNRKTFNLWHCDCVWFPNETIRGMCAPI